jgi:hypothetical protein
MSKRFERLSRNVEATIIGVVLVVVAIAYFVSRFLGVPGH